MVSRETNNFPIFSPPQRDEIAQLYLAAAVMTIGGLIAFVGIFIIRSGLVGNVQGISGIFALTLLPVWLPVWAITRFAKGSLSFALAILAGFFVGILLQIAGLFLGHYAILVACLAVAVSIIDGRGHFWTVLRDSKVVALSWALVCAILLVIFTEPVRVFLPEAVLLGFAPAGAYYNLSIAEMIAHYGAVSLGADGLIYRHYHFLAHVIAAGFATSSDVNMSLVYLYWGGLAVKLQLVWAAFLSGLFFFKAPGSTVTSVTSRLAYAWIATLLVGGFTGETFGLGTAMLLATLPVLMTLATQSARINRDYFVPLLIAIAAIFLVTVAKVSSGFFGALALLVILWRARTCIPISAIIGLSLALLGFVTMRFLAETDLTVSGYPLATIIIDYSHYFSWSVFFNFLLPILAIVILASRGEASLRSQHGEIALTYHQRVAVPSSGRILHWWSRADCITQFLIISILGCLGPLFLTKIGGGNNQYFSWTIYAFGFLFLPLAIGNAFSSVFSQKVIALILSGIIGFLLLGQSMRFLIGEDANLPQTITAIFKASTPNYRPHQTEHEILASWKNSGVFFSSLRPRIDATPIARLIRDLQTKSKSFGGRMVVNIPPEADEVWHALEGVGSVWCVSAHMMVPALAGIVEVRSIPPKNVEQKCVYPGTLPDQGFGTDQGAHRTADFSAAQLCALAKPLGARAVYKLFSYKDLSRNTIIVCR